MGGGGPPPPPPPWWNDLSQGVQNLGNEVKDGVQSVISISGGDQVIDTVMGGLQVVENASKGLLAVVLPGDIILSGDINFWRDKVNELQGTVNNLVKTYNDVNNKVTKGNQFITALKNYSPIGNQRGCALNFPTFQQYLSGTAIPARP